MAASTTRNVEVRGNTSRSVGLIGMGDMGKMYARCIAGAGWRYVCLSICYCRRSTSGRLY